MVKELTRLVEFFGTPLISGKDSSAGSTKTDEGVISVPPAVFLTALGKVPDYTRLLPNEWQKPGNLLVRIGPDCDSLAGTVFSRVFDLDANDVDDLSVSDHHAFLQALAKVPHGSISGDKPNGGVGTLGQAMLGALASGWGAELFEPAGGAVELLKEHRCGALVEVPEDRIGDIPSDLRPQVVGRITDRETSILVAGRELLSKDVVGAWASAYEESLR
jgi:phosphoribosylformylglycinamidine synthase